MADPLTKSPAYFTVRARALASFLTAIMGFLANLTTGILLDMPRVSQAAKSRGVYIGLVVLITACWAWNAAIEADLSSRPTTPTFDLGGGAGAGSALAVYMLFRFLYEALQTYLYWLMGEARAGDVAGDVARTTGILRSWESVGSTIAYVVGATHWSNLNQMILGFVLWGVTVPFTLAALFGPWARGKEVSEAEESSGDGSSVEVQEAAVAAKV